MKSQIIRDCLDQPSKSVQSSHRSLSPILRSSSKSPLKERKSVHFADSVTEEHDDMDSFPQFLSPCKPPTNEINLFKGRGQQRALSHPPPQDYSKEPAKESSTCSNEILIKSLEMRKQANFGRPIPVTVQLKCHKRSVSKVDQAKAEIQKDFQPKRMNFAFRDAGFYQKLNTYYSRTRRQVEDK